MPELHPRCLVAVVSGSQYLISGVHYDQRWRELSGTGPWGHQRVRADEVLRMLQYLAVLEDLWTGWNKSMYIDELTR